MPHLQSEGSATPRRHGSPAKRHSNRTQDVPAVQHPAKLTRLTARFQHRSEVERAYTVGRRERWKCFSLLRTGHIRYVLPNGAGKVGVRGTGIISMAEFA